jgi:hypothetical protein
MDKVSFIKVAGLDGVEQEYAVIDRGNEEFTSMLKETYDKMVTDAENRTI